METAGAVTDALVWFVIVTVLTSEEFGTTTLPNASDEAETEKGSADPDIEYTEMGYEPPAVFTLMLP
jgi:hypothetical protein